MQVVPHDCTTYSKTRGVAILFLQKQWSVPYESIVSFHEYLKTSVAFLYLTPSENESPFSLENISADGVNKVGTGHYPIH